MFLSLWQRSASSKMFVFKIESMGLRNFDNYCRVQQTKTFKIGLKRNNASKEISTEQGKYRDEAKKNERFGLFALLLINVIS